MSVTWVTAGLRAYSAELATVNRRLQVEASKVVRESSTELRDVWRDNARVTSGKHGKHYPKSIQANMRGPLAAEIAPNAAMKQGGMSFEYGSRNQPPHLGGLKAKDQIEPKFERALERAAVKVLP